MALTWYVVETTTKGGERASRGLRRAGFVVYRPLLRIERRHHRTKAWITRTLELFHGYLFVGLDAAKPNWLAVRAADGVTGVLGIAGVPMAIPAFTVKRVMARERAGEFDDTRAARIRRREIGRNRRETMAMRYPVGSRIRAVDGPFKAFRGHVVAITGRGTVEAMLELFGRLTQVEFPASHIVGEEGGDGARDDGTRAVGRAA